VGERISQSSDTKKRRSLVGEFHRGVFGFDRKSGVKICMHPQHPQKLIEKKTDRICFVCIREAACFRILSRLYFLLPTSPRTHP
jgi:hypothetical protein